MAPYASDISCGYGFALRRGLKQLDPSAPTVKSWWEYSTSFDAGRVPRFEEVNFCSSEKISRENLMMLIGKKLKVHVRYRYAFQELDDLPRRIWSTWRQSETMGGQDMPCSSPLPWSAGAHLPVINADDYYGPSAYEKLYRFLTAWGGRCGGRSIRHLSMAIARDIVGLRFSLARCQRNFTRRRLDRADRTKEDLPWRAMVLAIRSMTAWRSTRSDRDTLVSMNFFGFPEAFLNRFRGRVFAILRIIGWVMVTTRWKWISPSGNCRYPCKDARCHGSRHTGLRIAGSVWRIEKINHLSSAALEKVRRTRSLSGTVMGMSHLMNVLSRHHMNARIILRKS